MNKIKKTIKFVIRILLFVVLLCLLYIPVLFNMLVNQNIKALQDITNSTESLKIEMHEMNSLLKELNKTPKEIPIPKENNIPKEIPKNTSKNASPLKTASKENSKNIITREYLAKKTVLSSRGGFLRTYKVTNDTLKTSRVLNMKASAYDLSVKSCGKKPSSKGYGITASGMKVIYKTTIATDPSIIPTGSVVYIQFPKAYQDMNGIYVAMDTGSAIRHNKIDIYMGENKHTVCNNFGIRNVKVYMLK